MYTLQACNVPNGTMRDPYGVLARSAAKKARLDAATTKAELAYEGLLCRNPADFRGFGLNVSKDVQNVNVATGCKFQTGTPASTAAVGDPVAAAALASLGVSSPNSPVAAATAQNGGTAGGNARWRGGRSRIAGAGESSCELGGGVNVVPLNGPGSGGTLPNVSAAPAQLTLAPTSGQGGGVPGMYKARQRWVIGNPTQTLGLGQCQDLPWGDAYPNGSPASPAAALWDWLSANPWLAAVLAAGGLYLVSEAGKRG
jgi:hypothetical protein